MVVAFKDDWLAVPRTDPSVGTAVIWTSPSVRASVILRSQTERIHIIGLVSMAPRDVFSTHLDAMGYLIVMMTAMNVIVRWWLGFVFTMNFCFVYS